MAVKLNAKDYEARANIIFDQFGIKKPEKLTQAQIFQQINPALKSLPQGIAERPSTDRTVQGYSKALAEKIQHGSKDEKAYAKYVLAEAVLIVRVLEGKSSQTPELICRQIKAGSDKAYSFIPEQQRGLSPDQAHGLQVLFAELPYVSGADQTLVNIYNDLSKNNSAVCKGVLKFLSSQVDTQWASNFEGLMGCFSHLDQCVDPTILARSK